MKPRSKPVRAIGFITASVIMCFVPPLSAVFMALLVSPLIPIDPSAAYRAVAWVWWPIMLMALLHGPAESWNRNQS